jgi:hypothetical protein
MGKAIIVEKLIKNYEVTKKEPGLRGAISQLISPKKKTIKALKEVLSDQMVLVKQQRLKFFPGFYIRPPDLPKCWIIILGTENRSFLKRFLW